MNGRVGIPGRWGAAIGPAVQAAVWLLVAALAWSPASAGTGAETPQAAPEPGAVGDEVLVREGAVIGEIVIRAKPIFDTEAQEENRRLFRVANRLHRRTRDSTIRRVLLIRPGDPFSRRALEESERALRATPYLYDARVDVLRYQDNKVDVSVETRDVWTLGGGVSFGRSGGTNHSSFGIEEGNLFGLGKAIRFQQSSNVDRASTSVRYRDLNLLGGRSTLELAYADNSDGQEREFDLGRPFVSLDSHWTGGVRGHTFERVDSLYTLGHISSQFRHTQDSAELYGGLSRGMHEEHAVRWGAGLTVLEDRFSPESRTAAEIPEDRTLAYPWVEWSLVQDRFIKITDLDKIQRTEDFNLGREARVRLGYASRSFGSDRDQGILDASYASGYVPGEGQLLFLNAKAVGRFGSTGSENVIVGGGVRYLLRDWRRHMLVLSLSGDMASGLDAENQLTLGGDSGLRGYPLRYQDGDRRLLFTIEQRFYTNWHILRLVHVGAAVFADVGEAWFSGERSRELDSSGSPLRDVGLGLRLSSSRSARGSMVRLDLAFPLDGDPSISHTQFLVTTGERF